MSASDFQADKVPGEVAGPGGNASASRIVKSARVALLGAALLSACIVYFPWQESLGLSFPDRDSYLQSITNVVDSGGGLFQFESASVLALVLTEFLWGQILIFIGTYFQDPSTGLSVISLIAATLTAYPVIRKAGPGYAALMLFSPLAIDLFLSQIRSALALGIFLSALGARHRIVRGVLFAIAFFVHSFAAVLFAMYQFNELVLRRRSLSTRVKVCAALCFGLAASAVWAFLASLLLDVLGDRRAFYQVMQPATLAYALWWVLASIALLLFVRLKRQDGDGQFVMLAVILQALFVFSTLFGAAGLRFLSLSLPFFVVAVRTIRAPVLRVALLTGTVAFNCINVLYWLP
jgi:hypothetical protein